MRRWKEKKTRHGDDCSVLRVRHRVVCGDENLNTIRRASLALCVFLLNIKECEIRARTHSLTHSARHKYSDRSPECSAIDFLICHHAKIVFQTIFDICQSLIFALSGWQRRRLSRNLRVMFSHAQINVMHALPIIPAAGL